MKTIKLKHSLASDGRLSPAHPGAKPGPQRGGAIVVAVTGLPDDATVLDAIAILDSVLVPAWLYTIDAAQRGKNLYRAENLTPEQLAAAPPIAAESPAAALGRRGGKAGTGAAKARTSEQARAAARARWNK